MTITSFLALFSLLALSSGVYFLSQRLRFPYTVALAATGLVLVPLASSPYLNFIDDFVLTPEILFYLFLPLLIFESAFQMNIRRVVENIWSISALSVVSLLMSAFAIAGLMYVALPLVGLEIPFTILLLFGALISATDPVAVLALFKEYGVPKRLALLFEGESLFNDATAVALFFVVLEVALRGFHGASTVGEGVLSFVEMIVGGIVLGLFMGAVFSKLLGKTRTSESVSIMLMVVSAHLTFIIAELISQNLVVAGHSIHLSAIITTTISSMVIGNYGRAKVTASTEHFVEKFFGQGAFIVNSVIFILIGLLFSQLPESSRALLGPILVTIAIVIVARAFSIYPVIHILNALKLEVEIPRSWQHLLSWGSLRGALAIILVFLVPADWVPNGWQYDFTPQDFLLALTIGCIFTTLFIKALTIGPLMKQLGLRAYTPTEELMAVQTEALMYQHGLEKLLEYKEKGYVDDDIFEQVRSEYSYRLDAVKKKLQWFVDADLEMKLLKLHAIGIERLYLKDLYTNGEIPELVFRRIRTKLAIQEDAIEQDEEQNEHTDIDRKDAFEYLARAFRDIFYTPSEETVVWQSFMYYRAQAIIARKVLKELSNKSFEDIFKKDSLTTVRSQYQHFKEGSYRKMRAIAETNRATITPLLLTLAKKGMEKNEIKMLQDLYEREMVHQKVFVNLHERSESQV